MALETPIPQSISDLMASPLLSARQKSRISNMRRNSLYLLDAQINDRTVSLKVSGSTGNIYTVTMNTLNTLSCNCPDYVSMCVHSDMMCKHICFCLCKVGQLYHHDIFFTRILLESERRHLVILWISFASS